MLEVPCAPRQPTPGQLRPALVKHVRPFIELGDEAGVDVDALLGALQLTRAELRSAHTKRPYYQLQWLIEQLIEGCADPEIGLRAAERVQFARLDVLGHLIRHFSQVSSDLLSVLELLAAFWTRISGTTRTTLSIEGELVRIQIVPSVAPPPELYDSVAGASCMLIQSLAGADLRPLEVRLPRARPLRPERYEQFFGAPVVFESAELALLYPLSALRTPAHDAGLEHEGSSVLSIGAGGLPAQIRARLLATLAEGVPQLPRMAQKLGLSARTLRRRLSALHTGYAELVDESRRERALALASRGELDVARLAELSGFADASAFARAFRRWTGQPPREFIQRARARARGAAS